MTETTSTVPEKSREELEAELERLRTQQAAPVIATRDRSPVKPQDHQRGQHEKIRVDLAGEAFEIDARAPKHIPTMFALRQGDFETVLKNLIGSDGLSRVVDALADEDGFSDFEDLAELVNTIYEKAGSKNS